MKAFPIYTAPDDIIDHLVYEHDDQGDDLDRPDRLHDRMHLPGSVFGDSGHIHSDSPNRCAFPGCTGMYEPNLAGTKADIGDRIGLLTGWTSR